jgi:hypothetical protein
LCSPPDPGDISGSRAGGGDACVAVGPSGQDCA